MSSFPCRQPEILISGDFEDLLIVFDTVQFFSIAASVCLLVIITLGFIVFS